jgi:hypothetical protein
MRKTSMRSVIDEVDMPEGAENTDKRAVSQEEQPPSSPSAEQEPVTNGPYHRSGPAIDPEYSTIVPESSMLIRGLIYGILWSLVLIGIVCLVIEILRQIF